MSRKSVAFFSPTLQIGGVERVFITIANQLVSDYDITFILKYCDGSLKSLLSSEIRIVCTNTSHLRYILFPLTKVLWKYKFDYIFSGTPRTNLLLYISNLLAFNPSRIVTGQHNYLDVETSKFMHEKVLPYVFNSVYKTIAVSEDIRQMLIEIGVKRQKVITVHNPIDISEINQKSNEQCEPLDFDYMVFVGRVREVKNLSLLINSFELFSRREPNAKLIIIGDGNQKEKLIHLTHNLGLEDKIIWKGSKENPYPYIKKSRLVVLSSFSEAFPMVVLESFCLGKTVLSTNNKGSRYILENGKYGYLADTFSDPIIFCEGMLKAWKNPISISVLKDHAINYNINSIAQIIKDEILNS